ncbi:hypothetical protein Z949_3853 [Sulfitobacter guttiformis KCTC 32187]|nr:hypothetical protein Z949_3853 [Sulfitobacter guttiformis KCTC 32187]
MATGQFGFVETGIGGHETALLHRILLKRHNGAEGLLQAFAVRSSCNRVASPDEVTRIWSDISGVTPGAAWKLDVVKPARSSLTCESRGHGLCFLSVVIRRRAA